MTVVNEVYFIIEQDGEDSKFKTAVNYHNNHEF
jgi:hypothetical protein